MISTKLENALFRIIQGLIVLHEELMEEIYDWMEETEKQMNSIQVNENDVESLKEELNKQKAGFLFFKICSWSGESLRYFK